jgi:hypothetical protein
MINNYRGVKFSLDAAASSPVRVARAAKDVLFLSSI